MTWTVESSGEWGQSIHSVTVYKDKGEATEWSHYLGSFDLSCVHDLSPYVDQVKKLYADREFAQKGYVATLAALQTHFNVDK